MSIEIKQHLTPVAAAGDDPPAAAGDQAPAAVADGAVRHGPRRDAGKPHSGGQRRVGQRAGEGRGAGGGRQQRRGHGAGGGDRDADRRDPREQGRHDVRGEGRRRLQRGGQRLRLGGLPRQPGGGGADAVVQVEQRGPAVAGSDADARHVAVQPPGVAAQAQPLHAGRRRHRDADHRQPDAGRLPGGRPRGSGGGGGRQPRAVGVGARSASRSSTRLASPRGRWRSAC